MGTARHEAQTCMILSSIVTKHQERLEQLEAESGRYAKLSHVAQTAISGNLIT